MDETAQKPDDWSGKLKVWIRANTTPLYALSVMEQDNRAILLFQPKNNDGLNMFRAKSEDGFNFEVLKETGKFFSSHVEAEDVSGIQNARISKIDGKYIVFFQKKTDNRVYSATSTGGVNWREYRQQLHIRSPGMVVPNYKYEGQHAMYVGGDSLYPAFSVDMSKWEQTTSPTISIRDGVEYGVEYVMENTAGLYVFYHTKKHDKKFVVWSCGLVVFDKNNPHAIVWRTYETLWDSPFEWHTQDIQPLGAARIEHRLIGYWYSKNRGVFAVVYTLFDDDLRFTTRKISAQLHKPSHNPIISPNPENEWEAFNTFNPAAVYVSGKVHLIYRAQGHDYVSVFGYATSSDGIHIDERSSDPIFTPLERFRFSKSSKQQPVSYQYVSGGGYGGCEDPRITKIGDRLYMTYVAFDGVTPPRIALTSIAENDFVHGRWFWERPVLISPPGVVDKNAVIFPEKVGGKYVIFHRVYPNILIDFVDSLEFDGKTQWLKGQYLIPPRINSWDSKKIGAGAPPLKTKDGWLLIYQAVGYQDPHKYKIGAMLLDMADPTKVLYRSRNPILEPNERYENEGFKAGVVYPCGAVEIDGTLFVYYGGADSYVCVATAQLERFLDELKHFELPRLEPAVIRKVL